MFRRRNPLPIYRRLKEALWPSLGWLRAARYVGHRLGRLPGSPYRIAAGFACGAAVSFTPFIGLHFVLAALLALAMRGNLIASAIGTAIGNPWTFPFIWAWIMNFGLWMMGESAREAFPQNLTLNYIFENPLHVLLPMTVGGIPTAVAAWIVFFWPAYSMVAQYQRARRWRLRRRARARHRRLREWKAAQAAREAAEAAAKAESVVQPLNVVERDSGSDQTAKRSPPVANERPTARAREG